MDPFGITALILLVGGVTRLFKSSTDEAHRLAREDARRLLKEGRAQHEATVEALNDTLIGRAAYAEWLTSRLRRSLDRIRGKTDRALVQASSGFDGADLAALRSKLRRLDLRRRHPIDDTVMLASGAALLIEGLEFANRHGVDVPGFDLTLGDALHQIPGGDWLESGLGGFADSTVADLLGDGLVIFSVFRTAWRLWKIHDTLGAIEAARSHGAQIQSAIEGLIEWQDAAKKAKADQDEAAYQAFRLSLLIDAAHAAPQQTVVRRFVAALSALREALNAPLRPATRATAW